MQRSEKEAAVEDLKKRFDRMVSAVFVSYEGLDVPSVTQLRDRLRDAGVEYRVVKNTLVRRALEGHSWGAELAQDALRGMTAVAWSYEEPGTAAKVFKEFAKSNENLRVKAGVLDGKVIGAEVVMTTLATMPGRDELRARLLAVLQAPAQQFLQLLNAPAQNFLFLLKAREAEQQGEKQGVH